MDNKIHGHSRVALYGMFTGLAFVFGYIETLIPISLGVPGVKLGLANLVSIVSLYVLGAIPAVAIQTVRVILTGFTFGNVSMMMYSMAGTLLSLAVMVTCKKLNLLDTTGVSIAGGVAHNIGQLAVAALVMETTSLIYYLPVLLVAGSLAGAVIGIIGARVIRVVSKAFRRE